MKFSDSRRWFLRTAASGVALSALSYRRVQGANERIGLGIIGYGLIGKTHVATFRKHADADIGLCIVVLIGVSQHDGIEPDFSDLNRDGLRTDRKRLRVFFLLENQSRLVLPHVTI